MTREESLGHERLRHDHVSSLRSSLGTRHIKGPFSRVLPLCISKNSKDRYSRSWGRRPTTLKPRTEESRTYHFDVLPRHTLGHLPFAGDRNSVCNSLMAVLEVDVRKVLSPLDFYRWIPVPFFMFKVYSLPL